jgi:hypothetical protein
MANLLDSICNRLQVAAGHAAPFPETHVPVVRATAPAPAARTRVRPATDSTALPVNLIKQALDDRDRTPEAARVGRAGYLHVSSLIGLCARMQVLGVRHNIDIRNQVTGGHRVMWKIGRAVEKHVRGQFIQAIEHRGVYGRWLCVCKRTERTGHYDDRLTCPTCKGKLENYGEIALFDHENGIVGNPDLLFRHGQPFVITEIKSMTGEMFKDLASPLGDHIFQASLYHHLATVNNHPVHDEVVIFYTNKQFKFGSPYKEYHVDVTTPTLRQQVADAVGMACGIKEALANGVLPPREACSNQDCTRAKNCAAAVICWSLPQ